MKGVILAGGKGSRLYPITRGICKQLLPIYDKPMIYYPLSLLMEADISEILLISNFSDLPRFKRLLGNGKQWGISIEYAVQEKTLGIAEAFTIGKGFIGKESVALVLGDNLFYGHQLKQILLEAKGVYSGAMIFGYEVDDPSRYGVLAFDRDRNIVGIVEKPQIAPSRIAVTGLYFYDNGVVEKAERIKPSKRGELEITDINNLYAKEGRLDCHIFERGFAWLDAGTPRALHEAGNWVQVIQERQGLKVGCIEEIAFVNGWIDAKRLQQLADELAPSEYSDYLTLRLQEELRQSPRSPCSAI